MARRTEESPLELELIGERAHALGRVAAEMDRALREYREEVDPDRRAALAEVAAEWVWFYVIQRESLGWYRHEDALHAYEVPREIFLRMGPRRS